MFAVVEVCGDAAGEVAGVGVAAAGGKTVEDELPGEVVPEVVATGGEFLPSGPVKRMRVPQMRTAPRTMAAATKPRV
ncbi:hypothetical protein GCM10027269_13870 [Kribbella endophytica]